MLYDINGNIVYNSGVDIFSDNMELDYAFDSSSNANYTVIRIYQTKRDGTKQYPFVRSPGRMSALDLSANENWFVIINAGLGVGVSQPIDGIVIQNSEVIFNQPTTYSGHVGALPLTIDGNGNLSYASTDADANTLVNQGIVSAVCGFCPIIINYQDAPIPTIGAGNIGTVQAQRQIIGQFGNGDYAIITCEGRTYDNSDGWTFAEAQTICKKLGLKFAYNLDGGGSTETVIGKKQINTIYEETTGRKVPTFIVFNGTTTYSIPNA